MSMSTGFSEVGTVHVQCNALINAGLRDRILLPGEELYDNRVSSWWSATSQLRPYCIIQPTTVEDVSKTVAALNSVDGNFAVRSGGHTPWAGGSNIDEGVTIDLGLLNSTTYDAEGLTASIGPGLKWADVFLALEREEVMVPGGRDGNVGVGGFLLGGGNSYFTGRQGFGCDSLVGAEVVLGNGSIVNVNKTSNPDLLKALKGGSGNFGIVTRFDLKVIEAGPVWGGIQFSSATELEGLIDYLITFTDEYENHPEAAFILSFIFRPLISPEIRISYTMVDTKGVDDNPVFGNIRKTPELYSDLKKRPTSGLVSDYALRSGLQNVWHTFTFKNDARIVRKVEELSERLVTELIRSIPPEELKLDFFVQPIPKLFSNIGVANGGNVMGLDKIEGNALLWLCIATVKSAEYEPLLAEKVAATAADLERYAKLIDVMVPWVYLNYASPSQDPIAAYGEDNIRFLWEVSKKFDPEGLFQKRMRSGFKLPKI